MLLATKCHELMALLIQTIRKLLSLPFCWLGQLANIFERPEAFTLLKTAFAISGDGAVAYSALSVLKDAKGERIAREQADAWMQSHPRLEIAAFSRL